MMIQDLENNEKYTTEYLNTPPKKGDLAAVFKTVERQCLLRINEDGSMELPDASLFAGYWFDPEDADADKKGLSVLDHVTEIIDIFFGNLTNFTVFKHDLVDPYPDRVGPAEREDGNRL